MEANLMLVVAVISGANLSKLCVGAAPPSATATEAFATMLFLAFSSFSAFVFLWKDILLPASADGGGSGDPESSARSAATRRATSGSSAEEAAASVGERGEAQRRGHSGCAGGREGGR